MPALVQLVLDLFDPAPGRGRENPPPSTVAALPPEPLADVMMPVRFAHPRANRETRLCEVHVAYEFKRGRRRTIGMTIGADGLVVSAPRWAPVVEVEGVLQAKAKWIVRKLGEMRERQQRMEASQIAWRDGVQFPFLGSPLHVVLNPETTGVLCEQRGHMLHVGLPRAAVPNQIRDTVQAWLMRQARSLFAERLDHFAGQLDVRWNKLSLSSAGTRWGSARADGSIRLNWRLIHFRQEVIDYVVAHELSHLRVMDHSPRFWDTVASVLPDYRTLRAQLNESPVPGW